MNDDVPPVLLVFFSKENQTKKVLDAVRKAEPSRLYLVSDGPRENVKGEKKLVESIRFHVDHAVDWECEVKKHYRKKNLGCKNSMASAIKWFFTHEEMGIILEDDCIPDKTFFRFCAEMLHKYKNDTRIGQVSGSNNLSKCRQYESSYFFSVGGSVWGWATWRRVVEDFDFTVDELHPELIRKKLEHSMCHNEMAHHMSNALDRVKRGEISSWAYPWSCFLISNSMLSIIPSKNLIENIGFDASATHTKVMPRRNVSLQSEAIKFPLSHPCFIVPDREWCYVKYSQHLPSFRRKSFNVFKLMLRFISLHGLRVFLSKCGFGKK